MTMRLMSVLGLAICAAVATSPALADGHSDLPYMVPTINYIDDDRLRGVDDQFGGLQFNIGTPYGKWWDLEVGLFGANLDGFDEADQYGVVFDSHLRFSPDRSRRVAPYLLFGTGYMNTHTVMKPDEGGLLGALGFGVDWHLNNKVAFRTEARIRRDLSPDENLDDFLFSAGFRIAMGEPEPSDSDGDGVPDGSDRCPGTVAGVTVDSRGCELDGDGDGVVDRLDRCPDTRRGARVDSNGCEIKERDSDGDGVPDSADRCPDTPRGAKVDARGCELDGDNDGVVDRLDECPNTARGVRVNARGCPLQREVRLEGVLFEFNSSRLRGGAQDRLDEAVRTLELNPDLRVELAGHTDAVGPDSYNQTLSERRAASVRQYLIQHGIDGSRLEARGYGESQPVATNDTKEGRAQNRRVMMRVLNENISNTARPEHTVEGTGNN